MYAELRAVNGIGIGNKTCGRWDAKSVRRTVARVMVAILAHIVEALTHRQIQQSQLSLNSEQIRLYSQAKIIFEIQGFEVSVCIKALG